MLCYQKWPGVGQSLDRRIVDKDSRLWGAVESEGLEGVETKQLLGSRMSTDVDTRKRQEIKEKDDNRKYLELKLDRLHDTK